MGSIFTLYAIMPFLRIVVVILSSYALLCATAPVEDPVGDSRGLWDSIKEFGQNHLGTLLGLFGKRELSEEEIKDLMSNRGFWDSIKEFGQQHLGNILGMFGKREMSVKDIEDLIAVNRNEELWN